ncbi:YiiD C-terminal domain-containing protein [Marinicella sp. S1101]|uniref:YiiD C-terminal domain-containing protein n=1 Tax=Marinicella marina TaxID=2996016 RepID=UPI002260A18D|nr:YiiD C-terminal domain-containing protein [Marinicella marina]MCX7552773.1 YiiD C-terminal domain-containing protein [Marinicella marina]MDJ1139918.1 YiiD C-terminal domain-containing protein [Marinicella marina]
MTALRSFQSFLYQHIPLVAQMKMELLDLTTQELLAAAPLAPNINDKSTVFGGSSAALMTICGWSLIKLQLESHGIENDVVIHRAETTWKQAQYDDLIIKAMTIDDVDWYEVAATLKSKNRAKKITIKCQVLNQKQEICSCMSANYVVLKLNS